MGVFSGALHLQGLSIVSVYSKLQDVLNTIFRPKHEFCRSESTHKYQLRNLVRDLGSYEQCSYISTFDNKYTIHVENFYVARLLHAETIWETTLADD